MPNYPGDAGLSDFFPDPDIFGEGMPPDPIEELFGPWGPGVRPFGVVMP